MHKSPNKPKEWKWRICLDGILRVTGLVTFEQYHMRSRVTQTRARYRRGPSLMKVLKYWLRKRTRGANIVASLWLISPLHM